MDWRLLVLIAILFQYGLVPIAIKKIGAVEGSRTRKLVWQYFFAALLALTIAVLAKQVELSTRVLIVLFIGAVNAFACYCQWRAYDISVSRAAMMSNLDDLLAIGLGYAFLGELRLLTPVLTAGIAVSIISVIMFLKIKHPSGKRPRHLIGWVLGYTAIWGIAIFFMRFFSIQGLSLLAFVTAWYVGAWLGALFTRFVVMGREEAGPPLTFSQQSKVFLLSVIIWAVIMFTYFIRTTVPITIIQPIQLVAEMSVPVVIALVFFKEARNMSRKELVIITASIIGVTLIAIGF